MRANRFAVLSAEEPERRHVPRVPEPVVAPEPRSDTPVIAERPAAPSNDDDCPKARAQQRRKDKAARQQANKTKNNKFKPLPTDFFSSPAPAPTPARTERPSRQSRYSTPSWLDNLAVSQIPSSPIIIKSRDIENIAVAASNIKPKTGCWATNFNDTKLMLLEAERKDTERRQMEALLAEEKRKQDEQTQHERLYQYQLAREMQSHNLTSSDWDDGDYDDSSSDSSLCQTYHRATPDEWTTVSYGRTIPPNFTNDDDAENGGADDGADDAASYDDASYDDGAYTYDKFDCI